MLTRKDLLSLEDYSVQRADFRKKIMAHKKNRRQTIGPDATLYFEDKLTMTYQIQEMLRIEKIFEADAIQEELDTYNPLIPDGTNWKATFMLEYPDETFRTEQLKKLVGIERQIWAQVEGFDRVTPIADEDLERTDETRTSAVHFLRYELSDEMVAALKSGKSISMGIDHPHYSHVESPIAKNIQASLLEDLL